MKKLLLAMVAMAIAPFACAEATAPASAKEAMAPAATAAEQQSALTTQAAPGGGQVKTLLGERNCVQETGSHIVRKDKCVNATGQAYGQTAINRTGTYDAGVALERLSPAIQVQGR